MSDDASENDLLAAEYVLGLLPRDQARALEALAFHDPAVADSITAWEDRLSPLAETIAPVEPPAMLWRRLELATGIQSGFQAPANSNQSGASRSGLNLWRGMTAAGFAIAASLGYLLLRLPPPAPPGQLAALAPANAPAPAFLIRVGPTGQAIVLAQAGATPPDGRSFELWRLDAGAAAPVSLGVLPTNGQRQFVLNAPAGTQLLVSQEPTGGSPTGQPTGPVVFSGTLTGA